MQAPTHTCNQGFLWTIDDFSSSEKSVDVLYTEGYIWENPLLSNQKVQEAFQKAQVLYFD
ncbi:hypothetical protein PHSC3_000423 [Chlamydiales bacterium STE3]|nr:hypothetical protein PHSC3_000423 [Chlamydiales bacterium STE3]